MIKKILVIGMVGLLIVCCFLPLASAKFTDTSADATTKMSAIVLYDNDHTTPTYGWAIDGEDPIEIVDPLYYKDLSLIYTHGEYTRPMLADGQELNWIDIYGYADGDEITGAVTSNIRFYINLTGPGTDSFSIAPGYSYVTIIYPIDTPSQLFRASFAVGKPVNSTGSYALDVTMQANLDDGGWTTVSTAHFPMGSPTTEERTSGLYDLLFPLLIMLGISLTASVSRGGISITIFLGTLASVMIMLIWLGSIPLWGIIIPIGIVTITLFRSNGGGEG